LNPGDVFKWINFPEPQIGNEIKTRWFIYLGHTTTPFEQPILAHIGTTTTYIDDFKRGGKRASHRYFLFKKGKYPFDQECVLDFDVDPLGYKKADIESNPNIQVLGTLDERTLRSIYDGIYSSKFYSRKIRMDIRESLQQIGIKTLKK
jgi:hypothetical protein